MSEPRPLRSPPENRQRGYPGHSGYARIEHDYYREPAWAVDALLDAEPFLGAVFDPFCGGGTIPARCRARGMKADGCDIQDIGACVVRDFFESTARHDNIISNPPYKLAEQAACHALKLVRRKVAFFLRLNFLESQSRHTFFRDAPLSRVLVMARRVSCPPGIYTGERDQWGCLIQPEEKGGKSAYAWFVFDHGHVGETHTSRVSDWVGRGLTLPGLAQEWNYPCQTRTTSDRGRNTLLLR